MLLIVTGLYTLFMILIVIWIFSGGDDPQEHHQACHRRSLPCSDSLKLWAQHDQCGEEVNQGL